MLLELFIKSGYKARGALNMAVFHVLMFFTVVTKCVYCKRHRCIGLLMPAKCIMRMYTDFCK